MRISVKVKPNSKTASVKKIGEASYTVRVKAPAKEGKANDAVVEALGEYFDIPKSRISIARGAGSKNKILEICLEKSC